MAVEWDFVLLQIGHEPIWLIMQIPSLHDAKKMPPTSSQIAANNIKGTPTKPSIKLKSNDGKSLIEPENHSNSQAQCQTNLARFSLKPSYH